MDDGSLALLGCKVQLRGFAAEVELEAGGLGEISGIVLAGSCKVRKKGFLIIVRKSVLLNFQPFSTISIFSYLRLPPLNN